MRVLHVIPSVGPLRGGPSANVRMMARTCAEAGLDVDVATTDDNGKGRMNVSYPNPVVENGVTYQYFPRQTRFYTCSWPLTRWLANHVIDYDVVHIHALFSYPAIPAAYSARRYGVPYIVRPLGVLNRWGMENRRQYLKRISYCMIEKHILAGAAAIQYTSEQEKLEALELGIRQKSVVIPNSAEIPTSDSLTCGRFRAQYPQLADRLVILFLSRLDPVKGLDILLPAFAKVRAEYSKATLVIAGKGESDFERDLQQQAIRLGIASHVLWVGFLTGEQKWAALADADIFVLPSYSENFGLVVVEAMASGLAVVISDRVGIHREISDAHAGVTVPCKIDAVAHALGELVEHEEDRAEMTANGRRLVQTKFSPETVTEALVALYSDICTPWLWTNSQRDHKPRSEGLPLE